MSRRLSVPFSYLAKYCGKLKKIYVDFIAGLPGETPADEVLSKELMERLTRVSPKVCIHSHTFMPLPGTPMQYMPSRLSRQNDTSDI